MSTLKLLTQKLRWLNKRSTIISQNLAHKDVGGYKSKDLKPLKFQEKLVAGKGNANNLSRNYNMSASSGVVMTNPSHISSQNITIVPNNRIYQEGFKVTTSKKSVNTEVELQKLNDTSTEYMKMTTLYKKNIGWIKTALGKK